MNNELTLADFSESIQKGFIDYDLQKAVYTNNAQNRKLGRVGREYGGKSEKESSSSKTPDWTNPSHLNASDKSDLKSIKSAYDKGDLKHAKALTNSLDTIVREEIPSDIYKKIQNS